MDIVYDYSETLVDHKDEQLKALLKRCITKKILTEAGAYNFYREVKTDDAIR